MGARNVVLLELNEVPIRVLDRYLQERPTSKLANIVSRSRVYETFCEDSLDLNPWISWPTLHRGVSDRTHGILHLGQPLESQDREFPPVWHYLKNAGRRVGVFGSLHSSNAPRDFRDYAFYVPDYFSDEPFAHPENVTAFQKFNLAMTRQSARNVSTTIDWKSAVPFLLSAPELGITAVTGANILKQFADERRRPGRRIRRRNLQPLVMLDIFLRQMRRSRPEFATFYSNHVAAAMHRYWAALFPEDYAELSLTPEWLASYNQEILVAMDTFDVMLDRVARFVEEDGNMALVIATSLGQAAIPAEHTYSSLALVDVGRFMTAIGIPASAYSIKPTMVPCVSVVVSDEYIDRAIVALRELTVAGEKMIDSFGIPSPMNFERQEGNALHIAIQFHNYTGPTTALIGNTEYAFEALGLGLFAHEDGVACTAQHVPQGTLIVFDPNDRSLRGHSSQREQISTLEVAPAILQHFGLSAPQYMEPARNFHLVNGR